MPPDTDMPPPGAALQVNSLHLGLDGQLRPARIAAVELMKVLRPAVAIRVCIVFSAHALHQ